MDLSPPSPHHRPLSPRCPLHGQPLLQAEEEATKSSTREFCSLILFLSLCGVMEALRERKREERQHTAPRRSGTCWYIHNLRRFMFQLQFDIPVTYPATAPEIELPQLDGKTHKMYMGGKICLTVHFKPLWAKNSPRFGIAHALCLGLAPWLAAEVPVLVDSGMVKHKDDEGSSAGS